MKALQGRSEEAHVEDWLRRLTLVLVAALLAVQAAAAQGHTFTVSSPALSGDPQTGFHSGLVSAGRLDPVYAAKDGAPANLISFPFVWRDVPAGTKAIALILDDPDAAAVMEAYGRKGVPFDHWLAADINPALGGLPANASVSNPSFVQGMNSAGQIGYRGPQPPASIPKDVKPPLIHVYRLTLYALSAPTGLRNGFSLSELRAAMQGTILGRAQLLLSYSN